LDNEASRRSSAVDVKRPGDSDAVFVARVGDERGPGYFWKSITYPQHGASRGYIEKMFERLGIAADVKPKIIGHAGAEGEIH